MTSRIAKLNVEVASSVSTGQNAGSFIDQRQQLTNELSNLVDVSTIEAGDGTVTLTTSDGVPLVVEGLSFDLASQADPPPDCSMFFPRALTLLRKFQRGSWLASFRFVTRNFPPSKHRSIRSPRVWPTLSIRNTRRASICRAPQEEICLLLRLQAVWARRRLSK